MRVHISIHLSLEVRNAMAKLQTTWRSYITILLTWLAVAITFQQLYFDGSILPVHAGGTPRKIGWGCSVRFPKPLPYIWPKSAIFPTLFMTWPKIWCPIYDHCGWHSFPKHNLWRVLADDLIDDDEKVASSKKNLPSSREECKNHILFTTKMTKIDTLFMTKTAEKPYPLGPHIPI